MKEILEFISLQVGEKLQDKKISEEARKILEDIHLTLAAMKTKTWTVDDAQDLNNQLEKMRAKLDKIKEK